MGHSFLCPALPPPPDWFYDFISLRQQTSHLYMGLHTAHLCLWYSNCSVSGSFHGQVVDPADRPKGQALNCCSPGPSSRSPSHTEHHCPSPPSSWTPQLQAASHPVCHLQEAHPPSAQNSLAHRDDQRCVPQERKRVLRMAEGTPWLWQMGRGSREVDPAGMNQEAGVFNSSLATNIYVTSVWSLPLSGTQPSLKPALRSSCVPLPPRPSTAHTPGVPVGGGWATLTPEAKMAGFPLSSMSSSSSLVVVRPAAGRGHTEPRPSPWLHPPAPPPRLTDLQLPLDAALAAFSIVRLRGIVL